MSATPHRQTAPEDRISVPHRLIYGLGGFTNNLLAAASGGMMIVLNLGFGMSPALVGLLGALPRLTDAFTDPLMGYISDHADTRWGRRRPFIFGGAILAGILFALLWQMPREMSQTFYFVWFLAGSIVFYLAYTVFATPWVALGYELTPDYHERTRLMGTQNFISQLAYVVSPWFLWIMTYEGFFKNQQDGAAGLAIIIGVFTIAVGILPAIFLRERFTSNKPPSDAETVAAKGKGAPPAPQGMKENLVFFFKGMGETLKSGPFLKLSVATFLIFNGFILISSFAAYVIIYYVFAGDQEMGAKYAGIAGTVGAVSNFVIIIFITWLATKIGKRRALVFSTAVSIVGYLLKWVCYNPDIPWLVIVPAPLMSFGLAGLFTIVGSMIADVVDLDELQTHERREGMYGSIFWWVVKLGLAGALAAGGYLLELTGFEVDLGGAQTEHTIFMLRLFDAGIPALFSLIALWAVWSYPITEEKAREIREQLEARRGAPELDTSS